MTGFALDILNVLLVGVNIAITHGFFARMAVHAVERVFAFCKLRDGLVIVVDTLGWVVSRAR